MSRIVLLGIIGVAVIIAALALNYAISRDDIAEDEAPAAPTQDTDVDPQSDAAPAQTGPDPAAADGSPGAPPQPIRPDFDVVQINPAGGAVIAGRAAPRSEVTVVQDGRPVGTVVADSRGEWVLLPETPIAPGSHELGLSARLPGQPSVDSEDVVVVVVPEPREDIAGRQQSETGQALAMTVPRDGEGGATVLQAPTADPATGGGNPAGNPVGEGIADGSLVLDSLTYDREGRVTIGGRADPGARLRVYLGDEPVGTVLADETGRWQANPKAPVPQGLHDLRVEQVTPDGGVVAQVESPFMNTASDEAMAEGSVVVQPGNSLWRIARRSYGRGIEYTLIFRANRSQIEDPDLIYPGQVFALPPVSQPTE